MNDRYLFKAKRIDNGEWVDGFYLTIGDKAYIICEAEASCMYGDNTDLYATEWYEVQPETICQYTGLTDKNGERIWENDVIKYHFGNEYAPIKYGVYQSCFDSTKTGHCGFYVNWKESLHRRKDLGYWCGMVDAEIAGNIFDNPELLEGEKDE